MCSFGETDYSDCNFNLDNNVIHQKHLKEITHCGMVVSENGFASILGDQVSFFVTCRIYFAIDCNLKLYVHTNRILELYSINVAAR